MVEIKKYNVRLVKENSIPYELNNNIVTNPELAYRLFNDVLEMSTRTQEVFAICTLDIKNNVTGIFEVSVGGLSSANVHPREVFQRALLQNAGTILLCHNHPSGNPEPSNEDIKMTKRLMNAGNILGIEVIDHIIIGDESYLSLKEERLV